MESFEKKKRRRRENPVKKWTEREITMILDFIHETGNFEKPTAQIYYRKCLEQKPLDASWDLIRWKVRSLKTSFSKAEEWQKSTGAGLLGTEDGVCSVKAKIQKICPYYNRLKEISGDKSEGGSSYATYEVPHFHFSEEEQEDLVGCEEIYDITEASELLSDSQVESIVNETNELPPTPTQPPTPTPTTVPTQTNSTFGDKSSFNESIKCAEKLRKFAPKTAIGQLTQLQSERQAFQEKKLKLENEKLLQVADIEEKKLNFEKEKIWKQLALDERRLKLDEDKAKNEFELRKLEIEKEERIALREIEMKYKNK